LLAIAKAIGPDNRSIATAPSPIGVDTAAMVSSRSTTEDKPQIPQIPQISLCTFYFYVMIFRRWIVKHMKSLELQWRFIERWGCDFLEAVYQEALREELSSRNIPFRVEVEMPIFYKGKRRGYRAGFVCYESIIVELKAISKLSGIETA
jgi:hypothetical protein